MALGLLKSNSAAKVEVKTIDNNKINEIKKTKGIVSSEIELTQEKFHALNALNGKVDSMMLMQSKILEAIGLVSSDSRAIVDSLVAMSKTYEENNRILFDIAGNNKAIRSQIDSIANRISIPALPALPARSRFFLRPEAASGRESASAKSHPCQMISLWH